MVCSLGQGNTVCPWSLGDVANDCALVSVQNHHMRPTGDEHPAGTRLGREVICSPIAADAVFLDFKRLRLDANGEERYCSDCSSQVQDMLH